MAKRPRTDAYAGSCWAGAAPAAEAPRSAGGHGTPDCPIDLTGYHASLEPPPDLMGGGTLRWDVLVPDSAGSSGSLAPQALLQTPGGGSGGRTPAPGSVDGGGGSGSLNPGRKGAACGGGPGPQTLKPDPGGRAGAPGIGVVGGAVHGEGVPGGPAGGPAQEPAVALSDEQRMALDYAKRGCNLFITGKYSSCGPVVLPAKVCKGGP